MRNINTMTRREYLVENIFWAVLLFFLYRTTLFFPVFGWSYKQSLLFFAGIVTGGVCSGILLTMKQRRNHISLVTNLSWAYGLCHLISLRNIDRTVTVLVLALVVLITVAYFSLVFTNYIRHRRRKRNFTSIATWGSYCLLNSRNLTGIVLAVFLLVSAINPLLGLPLMEEKAGTIITETTQGEGETISSNIDTLLLLQQQQWSELDASERLRVMKVVADIEANYLGFPAVSVCTQVLEENTLGCYDHETRTITLNLTHLVSEDAFTMCNVVCHESRHAYQHRLIDIYESLDPQNKQLRLFLETSMYSHEFSNYIDGNEDYEAYYSQWCEIDSREYAQTAAEEYFRRIEKHKTKEDTP